MDQHPVQGKQKYFQPLHATETGVRSGSYGLGLALRLHLLRSVRTATTSGQCIFNFSWSLIYAFSRIGVVCPDDNWPSLLVKLFASKTNACTVLHSGVWYIMPGRNFIFFASYEKLWTFNPGKSFSSDTICLPIARLQQMKTLMKNSLKLRAGHVLNVFFVSLLSKE